MRILRLNKDHTKWEHYQLRSGTKWQNINKPINREYQINAYRVLLTRARQGMVLVGIMVFRQTKHANPNGMMEFTIT